MIAQKITRQPMVWNVFPLVYSYFSPLEFFQNPENLEPCLHTRSIKDIATLLPLKNYSQEEIQAFFETVYSIIGKERFTRTQERLNALFGKMVVTKESLRVFLLLLFDIQKIDIDEYGGDPLEAYRSLIPFESFDEFKKIFLDNCPSPDLFYIDIVSSASKSIKGLEERVFLTCFHEFQVRLKTPEIPSFLRDAEMLSSRFIDREPPDGTVIHLEDGLFYVATTFCSGGAYIALLKDFTGNKPPKIVCRGTAFRWTSSSGFASGINDLLPEMGMMGIHTVWPFLHQFLKEQNIQSVEIFGKSLGGATAQELCVLIEGVANIHVDHLITVCSVGIGRDSNQFFLENVLPHHTGSPLKISVLRNNGQDIDYVPVVGGTHLGFQASPLLCTRSIYNLFPSDSSLSAISETESRYFYIKKLISSLGRTHCRQTTLKNFSYSVTTEAAQVNNLLNVGELLENVRQRVATIFKRITLHRLNYSLQTLMGNPTS